MSHAKPGGVIGVAVGLNAVLAVSRFAALLWVEVAFMLVVVGLLVVRIVKVGKARRLEREL